MTQFAPGLYETLITEALAERLGRAGDEAAAERAALRAAEAAGRLPQHVGHTGEMPIALTWRLQHRLPGDLYQAYAAVA
jgi:hypothetical protein